MNEEQKLLQQKVDLHYGRTDYSINLDYVEFSFHACFYEIFRAEKSGWESNLNGDELASLLHYLNIPFDGAFLRRQFEDKQNHDVEVYHSTNDEMTFAYFDLEKDLTDQNEMFYFGLVCKKSVQDYVITRLVDIYRKLNTTSPFQYDIWNHQLYFKTFRSYSYFYYNEHHPGKRKINHW